MDGMSNEVKRKTCLGTKERTKSQNGGEYLCQTFGRNCKTKRRQRRR